METGRLDSETIAGGGAKLEISRSSIAVEVALEVPVRGW
jgi:hypothetical protein